MAKNDEIDIKKGRDDLLLVLQRRKSHDRSRSSSWTLSSSEEETEVKESLAGRDQSVTEDEDKEKNSPEVFGTESREMAVVTELLEKYTTIFEGAP